MTDPSPVVTLDAVTVTYGNNPALRDVTAAFSSGAIGLLGPNGAGKSTMLKALLGFVVPERGRMRVLGLDVAASPLEIRARVGYMPESDAHIPGMNAVSFVAYCGELAGLPRVDAMQRAHEMLALVRDLAHNKGVNLILSSHLLPDVEYTCDSVVVMDKGAIATQGPIVALKQPRGRVFELRVKTRDGATDGFVGRLRAAGLECHASDEDVMRVFVPGEGGARELFALAAAEGVQVRHLRPSVPTLEDVFAHAVGEE